MPKTKSFEFLQKETPIEAFVKGLKQPFFSRYSKKEMQNLAFELSDGQIKKLEALLHLGKSPSQTVCDLDTN